MIGRKRILRVVAVLSVAVAAGELVETLRPTVATARLEAAVSVGQPELTAAIGTPGNSLPGSASLDDGTGDGLPRLTGITPVAATAEGRGPQACDVALGLTAAAGAMIDLALSAPCHRGERVVIRHSGLSFTAVTPPEGQLRLQIPALEADALVAAYFDGSEMTLATVSVPDAAAHVRFGVQMHLPAQFDLRAEENGQVFSGSSGGRTADGGLRKIALLGTAKVAQPLLAQVYTLPADDPSSADLTVELRITPETCGRTLPVETILARGGKVTLATLAVEVPLCGTSGDILLLKNLLRDLTLAAPR
ncbi:hypothetical protein [Tabrizicola sp.]|uniref:hypothetical protein n=1 Tax=Tabrizicola sp. TaxID=2005166 RepID=UPI00262B821A|nr:hypothetical protein [Tabrizicola sp.]MDM7931618.1 hypothetical protein [Tabrizicola sp.]